MQIFGPMPFLILASSKREGICARELPVVNVENLLGPVAVSILKKL
jgi:hypothetical protein